MEVLSGSVEEIVFYNDENGYCICDIDAGGKLITIVGYMPALSPGETITVEGNYQTHPIYGEQFSVSSFTKNTPNSKDAIYKYLASGLIKGIGPVTASKIVDMFDTDTLKIIETAPDKLAKIRGISVKKAYEINEEYIRQFGVRSIVMFLQEHDISPIFASRIYQTFGATAIDKIKKNPYLLAQRIHGIGFLTADKMAMQMGVSENDEERVKAAVQYVLQESATNGNTYLPRKLLVARTCKLTNAAYDMADNAVAALAMEHWIKIETIDDEDRVYAMQYYLAEVACARRLKELNAEPPAPFSKEYENLIGTVEQKTGIYLEEKQKQAVACALTTDVSVITGGPGTGKTTVINTIIRCMEMLGKKVMLAAPTGRAAKRMSEVTNREAKTVHRLLETSFSPDNEQTVFQRNETNPLETQVLIVDEMSMVDVLLFHSLLKALTPGTTLILVGDADQLPSVGPGNVLRDIIASEGVAVNRLTEIFRQAKESMIVVNAHRIHKGQMPLLNVKGKDFFFMPRQTPAQIIGTIVQLCTQRLPATYGCSPFTDIQVLTPMRKNAVGVSVLNSALQQALNPPDPSKKEKEYGMITYRVGDKVMQIRNNYDIEWTQEDDAVQEAGNGLFNGDLGILQDIDAEREEMAILFDEGKSVDYSFRNLQELELAYATTIHKSQGSEFPIVILPLFSGAPSLMTRNLLYTAVTRAKELVILVGQEAILQQMVENNSEIRRYSGLQERLRYE